MNLLLDTHVFLWLAAGELKLAARAREHIADPQNSVYVSAVTAWEIAIKRGLGKLEAPTDIKPVLESLRFRELPVTIEHAQAVEKLPGIHSDPFDRLLIAQAAVERLHLVTRDAAVKRYDIRILLA